MQIHPYLHFQGNCEEAFGFYAQLLGGELSMMKYRDAPAEMKIADEMGDKVMHVQLKAADAVLLGSDSPSQYTEKPAGFGVSLMLKKPAKADRIFAALAQGGEVRMDIQETFWAARFGMVTDKFGVPWMVNCEKPA